VPPIYLEDQPFAQSLIGSPIEAELPNPSATAVWPDGFFFFLKPEI